MLPHCRRRTLKRCTPHKPRRELTRRFEMDFEMTCAIKARSRIGNDDAPERGTGGAVVRKREAWEESKPSAKRGRF